MRQPTNDLFKLVRFSARGSNAVTLGAWVEDDVVDLPAAVAAYAASGQSVGDTPFPETMMGMIEGGDPVLDVAIAATAHAREQRTGVLNIDDVQLRLPIDRPGKILCFGRVYQGHIEVGGYEVPPRPNIFLKGANCLVGPDEQVVLPYGWDRFTYGTELCLVMGRAGRRATEEDAFDWVYGYTILNDVTARGEMQPKNKLFDTFAPVGPCVVPRRFIADPASLTLVMHVNGELTQQGDVALALWSLPRLIKDATEYISIELGDLVSTGDLGAPDLVVPGDTLEASIEPLGVLRNPVVLEEGGAR